MPQNYKLVKKENGFNWKINIVTPLIAILVIFYIAGGIRSRSGPSRS